MGSHLIHLMTGAFPKTKRPIGPCSDVSMDSFSFPVAFAGDLATFLQLIAYQLALPFFPEDQRQLGLAEDLSGATF